MRYKFQHFDFDSESLILKKHQKNVAIRHNEAQLLKALLENADKPLSKEEILEQVWSQKVVSDQAVFQNISHLRTIFGKAAIKTFSKRGYQWQLPFERVQPQVASEAKVIPSCADPASGKISKKQRQAAIIFASLGITVIATLIILVKVWLSQEQRIEIAYIPFATEQGENSLFLSDSPPLEFVTLEQLTTAQYELAAELEYQKLSVQHPLLLFGYLRTYNNMWFLDFTLKGRHGEWQGMLSALDQQQLLAQLKEHLNQPFIYSLVDVLQSPETNQANLSLAHQQTPNDLIVLAALSQSYIRLNEPEKAMALADKLFNVAVEQKNARYQGKALLLQSTILTGKQLIELSAYKLQQAIEKFKEVEDLKLQADAWNAQSWLDHLNKDYRAIVNSLQISARLAREAQDIERELHALTYLSVLAHKHNQIDDKYTYLNEAENKMRIYQVPQYRFAKIPFHHAIYADSKLAKEPHLKQVLAYTKLTPDHWIAQSSRKQLMEQYLEQDRLDDASDLVAKIHSNNAKNVYLKTLLAQANEDQNAFIEQAQKTFELAQLSGELHLSLDVALLMCISPSTQENFDFYSHYIEENATLAWRSINKAKLTALKI